MVRIQRYTCNNYVVRACDEYRYYYYAKMYDIDIYVHTVNDVEEARNRLYCGVKGIYTDDITPEILK